MTAKQSPLFALPDGVDRPLKLATPKPPVKPAVVRRPAQATPPPRPVEPCHMCYGRVWWLLADGSAWRCGQCHPTLAVADLRWHLHRRPIRFTVASHHWDNAGFLADPNAYTIMAWVPTKHGWTAARNLSLLAPTSDILRAYRAHDLTAAGYTEQFNDLLHERLGDIVRLLHRFLGQHMTLLCACPFHDLDEGFCHRFLVARLLTWLGCQEEAWVAQRREATPVAQPTPATGRIYVDELVDRGWRYGPNCHMVTDDLSEAGIDALHAMAKQIGLKRTYFQDKKASWKHYDLNAHMRELAVKAGAIEVTCREWAMKARQIRQEMRAAA